MATYNKPDWKERAKPLTESDFFVDFEEPTVESDPPAVEPARQLKTWVCWYEGTDIGTVEAYDEYDAANKMMANYPQYEYNNTDWFVEPADEEYLKDYGLIENVEEPDNAVVDCKVNKVIAHCEDEKPVDCEGKKKPLEKPLTEGRTSAEIRAEIAKLQQELADAEVEEKKASYGGKLPTQVWIWNIIIKSAKNGFWTSAQLDDDTDMWDGIVFETENAALDAAWIRIDSLADEGELCNENDIPYDPDDYYVTAVAVPISEVHEETLSNSGLDHLID